MNDSARTYAEVIDAAQVYGQAVWGAQAEVFEALCHERFQMTHIAGGETTFWDKASYLERVRGRAAAEGPASFAILAVDVAGTEMARVQLWVDVPPLRYEDHLGFVKQDGTWKLLTKVFRTIPSSDVGE